MVDGNAEIVNELDDSSSGVMPEGRGSSWELLRVG